MLTSLLMQPYTEKTVSDRAYDQASRAQICFLYKPVWEKVGRVDKALHHHSWLIIPLIGVTHGFGPHVNNTSSRRLSSTKTLRQRERVHSLDITDELRHRRIYVRELFLKIKMEINKFLPWLFFYLCRRSVGVLSRPVLKYLVKTKSADSCDSSIKCYPSILMTKLMVSCQEHNNQSHPRTMDVSELIRGEVQQKT